MDTKIVDPRSDLELIALYKQTKDADAINLLLLRKKLLISKFLWEKYDLRGDHDDVVQLTLVEMVLDLDHFDVEQDFNTWVIRLAQQKAQDHFRYWSAQKRDRRREQPLASVDNGEADLMDTFAWEETVNESVQDAIDDLPANEQSYLRSRFYDDLNQVEIAEQTGLSNTTVNRLHHKALRGVKQVIEQDYSLSA